MEIHKHHIGHNSQIKGKSNIVDVYYLWKCIKVLVIGHPNLYLDGVDQQTHAYMFCSKFIRLSCENNGMI